MSKYIFTWKYIYAEIFITLAAVSLLFRVYSVHSFFSSIISENLQFSCFFFSSLVFFFYTRQRSIYKRLSKTQKQLQHFAKLSSLRANHSIDNIQLFYSANDYAN